MKLNKQSVIPVAIIIILSVVALFKITAAGVVVDSVFAYFTGMGRYFIYVLAIGVGLVYATYPKLMTDKRLAAVILFVVASIIFSEVYAIKHQGFTNLPGIGEITKHYFDTQTMLTTGGGLIGLIIVLALKPFISSILGGVLVVAGLYFLIDIKKGRHKRKSKPKQKKPQKQKPIVTPKEEKPSYVEPEPYQPVHVDPSELDDNPLFKDNFDDDVMEQPIKSEKDDELSYSSTYDFDLLKVSEMKNKIDTVLENYDIPLEYVDTHTAYNDDNQVVYEYQKTEVGSDLKPSDIKAMRFDIEMGLGVKDIRLIIPFEGRSTVGIVIYGWDIK